MEHSRVETGDPNVNSVMFKGFLVPIEVTKKPDTTPVYSYGPLCVSGVIACMRFDTVACTYKDESVTLKDASLHDAFFNAWCMSKGAVPCPAMDPGQVSSAVDTMTRVFNVMHVSQQNTAPELLERIETLKNGRADMKKKRILNLRKIKKLEEYVGRLKYRVDELAEGRIPEFSCYTCRCDLDLSDPGITFSCGRDCY